MTTNNNNAAGADNNAAGAAGAGADDKGAAGADNNAAGAAGAGADDKGAASSSDANQPYKPDGLADHYLGKDDKETIDKLNKAVVGFREGLTKKGVPENPDGYTLELPDEIKTKVLKLDENGKDPVLEKMKPILHKHGIPAPAFQELAKEFYGAVAEIAGAANTNADGTAIADFEYKELGGADAAKPQIEGAEVWINGLLQSKKISEKGAQELKLLTGYSEGLGVLNELRTAMGDKPIPKNLNSQSPDGITEQKILERWQDPRSWQPGSIDDDFINETRRMQRILDGNAA